MKASRHPLYHRFLKHLKNESIQDKKILIACSGGIDSVCLLDLMLEVSSILNLKISVAHVHHGNLNHAFRNLAQMYVHSLCLALDLDFYTQTYMLKKPLISENDLRKYRYQELNKWMAQTKSHYLALAHSSDDLLETRLIRLIRGTGTIGLPSMRYLHKNKIRPLLFFTKEEIKDYAHFQKITPIEDPSNQQDSQFRNWIRLKWLKQLKDNYPRSIENFSKSLEKISLALENSQQDFSHLQKKTGILKKEFLKLPVRSQKQFLVQWIHSFHLKNYTETQVEELLKFIQKNDKNSSLRVMNQHWSLSSNYIKMNPLIDRAKKCYTSKRGKF